MELNIDDIVNFLKTFIDGIPKHFQVMETVLGNVAYFVVNSLAIVGKLDDVLTPEKKAEMIDWVYSNQVQPPLLGGFRHSPAHFTPNHTVEEMHLVMTFSYLATLLLLGDDLSRVDVPRVMEGMKRLQLPSGSFIAHMCGSEDDLRFMYSAAAITKILGTTDGIDVEKAINYTLSCQTYEGGFAYKPGDEAHGGATFCAVATLSIWNALDRIRDKKMLAYWLSQRQIDGFNGRAHKATDTCYSFWIGCPLTILGWYDDIVDKKRLISFIFSNYCGNGMFRSSPGDSPDLLHTHFSLCGLSLAGYPGLQPLNPSLSFVTKNIPEKILNLSNST